MKTKSIILSVSTIILLAAAITIGATGCASTKNQASTGQGAKPTQTGATGKGGSQLWVENCARCHNIRSPSSYSDAQWDVAMLHMRVRANLTAEEHKKILEFLKSAD